MCVVQFAKSCPIPCDPMDCSTPVFPVLHYSLELVQIHVHGFIDIIQPSHPQSFPASGSFPVSQLFTYIRWPNYWSFSINFNPSSEYSGLISFRMDWFDLLVVQETLKSLLQHHILRASVLWCSVLWSNSHIRT